MVPAKSAHPPREVRSAVRSEHILDAAANLFAERGFHHTTTRDIAEAADVAEGARYNYFSGKDVLLNCVSCITIKSGSQQLFPWKTALSCVARLVRSASATFPGLPVSSLALS